MDDMILAATYGALFAAEYPAIERALNGMTGETPERIAEIRQFQHDQLARTAWIGARAALEAHERTKPGVGLPRSL